MIADGEGYIIRHSSGRFFRSDCVSAGFPANTARADIPSCETVYLLVASPFAADVVRTRQFCGRFLDSDPAWSDVRDQFDVIARPGCGCCGEAYAGGWIYGGTIYELSPGLYRCDKHRERNPCAIEGCRRTTAATAGAANDQWLCSEHWRRHCPPRSSLRRTYHRFFRLARKTGWTPELRLRFDRFWNGLIKRARRAGAGVIDMTEIEKMFGWAA